MGWLTHDELRFLCVGCLSMWLVSVFVMRWSLVEACPRPPVPTPSPFVPSSSCVISSPLLCLVDRKCHSFLVRPAVTNEVLAGMYFTACTSLLLPPCPPHNQSAVSVVARMGLPSLSGPPYPLRCPPKGCSLPWTTNMKPHCTPSPTRNRSERRQGLQSSVGGGTMTRQGT